ncbi:MAG: SDR family oxidoreductase [Polyangiales bacterium]
MDTVLIVGANRGIGLELCRQHAKRGDAVHATTRKPSPELDALTGVEVHEGVEVTSPESVSRLAAVLGAGSLDRLVVAAGILKPMGLDDFDPALVREQFEVNALGVLSTTVALLPCLSPRARVALLTSRMGSIADNTSGGSYAYRMSKAALNIAGRSLAVDLAPREIHVAILHPGWVRTDMTGGSGLIDAGESAAGIIARTVALSAETSGRFFHHDGQELPW